MIQSVVIWVRSWAADKRRLAAARRLLPLVMLALILVALFYFVPIPDLVSIYSNADKPYLTYGLLVIIPFLFFDAMQLGVLVSRQGMVLSTLDILRTNLVARFYQLFVPGSLIGSGIRIYGFSRATNQPLPVMASLAYNRIYNLVLAILFGLVFWIVSASGNYGEDIYLPALLGAAGIAGLLVLPFVSHQMGMRLHRRADFAGPGARNWLLRKLHGLLTAFSSFSGLTVIDQAKMVGLGLIAQIAALLSYYWLAVGIGIEVSFADMGWIRSVIVFSLSLPVNISAGFTVREIGFAAILVAIGVSVNLATAFSLLVLFRSVLIAMSGGAIELIRLLRPASANRPG